MKRAYKLGKILREKFNKFLGEYKPEEVYAFSTDFDRTKISLRMVLSGLYPHPNWSDYIHWSHIPTYYEPNNRNFLYVELHRPR